MVKGMENEITDITRIERWLKEEGIDDLKYIALFNKIFKKNNLRMDEVVSLYNFYGLKTKQNWTDRLIIESFLNYRKNINKIIAVENWLFFNGICSNNHRLNMRDLNILAETLNKQEDYDLFVGIYEKNIYYFGLNYILCEFMTCIGVMPRDIISPTS